VLVGSVVIPLRGTTNDENIFVFFVFFVAKHFQVSTDHEEWLLGGRSGKK